MTGQSEEQYHLKMFEEFVDSFPPRIVIGSTVQKKERAYKEFGLEIYK